MRYNGKKGKSFVQSFTWVGLLLLALGVVFIVVAAVMQLVPLSPANMHMYTNGIQRPATEETVRIFRLVFLLTFGIIGLLLAIAGGIVAGQQAARRRRAKRLKKEGVRITAEVMDYSLSAVRINYRFLTRLRCAYKDSDGTTYIFRSDILRADPAPYLQQGQVDVYHDRNDISKYFVDVDGSAGLSSKIVEL